jgi:uncharacterized protein (TIGR02246 family)
MHFRRAAVVIGVLLAFLAGYFAHGQNREQPADSFRKAGASGKAPAPAAAKPDPAKKPAESAKKPAGTGKLFNAQPPEDPEEKLIRAAAAEFTKRYNAHDARGLAALFSPKAEMIHEDGLVTRGRDAIENEFVVVFTETPKTSMQVQIESVRVLTPALAIEEGKARSQDSPDDPEDATVYVAIHVKLDGKWQLACVRDWEAPPEAPSPRERLEQELSWLVGEWIDEGTESDVRTVCRWHDNGNFLIQEFEVNVAGVITMTGTMRIGWNAVARQFQSWVFDSLGGHSMGFWVPDGDRWIVKLQGATAAGEVASSTNSYRPVGADTIAWGSFDRVVDGERQDDIEEIVVKRRAPLPSE